MSNCLIIVDVQHDFLPGRVYPNHTHTPDGALAVPEGNEIIEPIKALVKHRDYDVVLASCDWHPSNHISFKENGGVWPRHCVANTPGAQIEQSIEEISDCTVYKGFNPEVEAYSAFEGYVYHQSNNIYPDLYSWLEGEGVTDIDVCGLALDYCVLATAIHAKTKGYNTGVFLDLTRPVQYITGVGAIESMAAHKIELKTFDYKI